MGALDFDANASFGENGSGQLFVCTDYDGAVFADGTGSNEGTSIQTIEENYTFADVGYFEDFVVKYKAGEDRVIPTDYVDVLEIKRTTERIGGFSVVVQEILEMENLAIILGVELQTATGHHRVGIKRKQRTIPYLLFKFVTAPVDGLSKTYYFVKAVLTGDIEIPVTNLNKADFAGTPMEFEIAPGGNFFIDKETATPVAEVQTLTVDATAGNYTITWNGQTTANITFNAVAATVQAAMEALSNVGVGDVIVTGGVGASGGGTPYTFTWDADKGNVSQPTTTNVSLTGGGATAVFATVTPGV